jgi:glycosyltransferase involved in cell wall biosynthesis
LKPDGVTVTGPLADLSSVFDRIRLTLAPLSYGAGIKGKIVDSLAAGIPCVYTGIAGEGMSLPAELNVCRADDDDAISEAVKQLHEDAELNRKCSAAGLSYVRQELSEMTLDRSMKQVVGVERPVMN